MAECNSMNFYCSKYRKAEIYCCKHFKLHNAVLVSTFMMFMTIAKFKGIFTIRKTKFNTHCHSSFNPFSGHHKQVIYFLSQWICFRWIEACTMWLHQILTIWSWLRDPFNVSWTCSFHKQSCLSLDITYSSQNAPTSSVCLSPQCSVIPDNLLSMDS